MADYNQYQSQYQYQNQYPPNPNNGEQPGQGAAIASLVVGIVGLFFMGFILGIVGLGLAASAKSQGYEGGIRTAGFVLSLLSLIFSVLWVVACLPFYCLY